MKTCEIWMWDAESNHALMMSRLRNEKTLNTFIEQICEWLELYPEDIYVLVEIDEQTPLQILAKHQYNPFVGWACTCGESFRDSLNLDKDGQDIFSHLNTLLAAHQIAEMNGMNDG